MAEHDRDAIARVTIVLRPDGQIDIAADVDDAAAAWALLDAGRQVLAQDGLRRLIGPEETTESRPPAKRRRRQKAG